MRQTDLLKVQEKRSSKRKPDIVRPYSPLIGKRSKFESQASMDSSASSISSNQSTDDLISMSQSYVSRGSFKNARKIGPASFMRAQENKLKIVNNEKAKVVHDSVEIMHLEKDGTSSNSRPV